MTRDEYTRRLIFGDRATKCNLAELSRETDIPVSTLRRWKAKPGSIPLDGLRKLQRTRHIEPAALFRVAMMEEV